MPYVCCSTTRRLTKVCEINTAILSLLCVPLVYAPFAAHPTLFSSWSTCTLVFRRVFAHAHAVLPLLWYMQGVARFLLGEAPCKPLGVNRLGSLALGLGQMG